MADAWDPVRYVSPELFEELLTRYRERLFALLPAERPFAYAFRRVFLVARKH